MINDTALTGAALVLEVCVDSVQSAIRLVLLYKLLVN